MNETECVVELIRDVGVSRLANWDGCCCSDFKVRNVHVRINCGKSAAPQGVVVFSGSMDFPDEASLQPVMDEVLRQVREQSGRSDNWAQSFSP